MSQKETQRKFLISYGLKKKEKINVDLDWSILDQVKLYFPKSNKMHVMSYREISHYFLYKESIE